MLFITINLKRTEPNVLLHFININNCFPHKTGCVDGCILATLAFILATRHVRLQPEPMYQSSMYKGEVNNAYLTDAVSIAGSRKSLNMQPVLLVSPPHHMGGHNGHHGDDSISQFSSRTANRYARPSEYHHHGGGRPDYHHSMHQFQL